MLGAGSSGNLGTGTAGLGNPQSVAVSLSTGEKGSTQETRPAGIPPAGSKWAFFHEYIPTVDLTNNGDPTDATPLGASTPIKTTSVPERRLSGKKLNVTKMKASHLLFDMRDWQERVRKSTEAENHAAVSEWTSDKERGSGGGLLHGLPATLPNLVGDGLPTMPSDLTLEAPKRGTKRPYDDNEITKLPDEGKPAGPPKKKKKKK